MSADWLTCLTLKRGVSAPLLYFCLGSVWLRRYSMACGVSSASFSSSPGPERSGMLYRFSLR